MNALITGAGGFVGGHLLTYLSTHSPDVALYGTLLSEAERRPALNALCQLHVIDLRDEQGTHDLLAQLRPARIFHLAGQAFVPRSFEEPWETLEINIRGTLSILQAVHNLKLDTRLLIIGSAEVYGAAALDMLPLTEDAPFAPSSPYSVSKVGQDMLALQYNRAHHLYTVRVRPFNHIGPGQNTRFAVSDWAAQIAQAEAGLRAPVVEVGNLAAARDFTDVRDVVRAYALALESGRSGDVFNVCSGRAYTMQVIVEKLASLSMVPIEIRVAPERFRPVEIPILYGSYQRLHERTGWQPEIGLEQSLRDVLDEWRQRTRQSQASAT